MASSLLALLSQQNQSLQTRKALIILNLQNDFLASDGKLPVSNASDLIPRLTDFVPRFREFGDVVWSWSQFDKNQPPASADESGDFHIDSESLQQPLTSETDDETENERDSPVPFKRARKSLDESEQPQIFEETRKRTHLDDSYLVEAHDEQVDEQQELILMSEALSEPPCIPGSYGAAHPDVIQNLIQPKDLQFTKSAFSAFASESLLPTLRARLVTELYICGTSTNFSVYATSMDAARYGMRITLVEDCLGYIRKSRHAWALQKLRDDMDVEVLSSAEVIDYLKNPPPTPEESEYDEYEYDEYDTVIEDAEDANLQHDEEAVDHIDHLSHTFTHGIEPDALEVDSDEDESNDMIPDLSKLRTSSGRVLEYRFKPRTERTLGGLPKAATPGPESPPDPERQEILPAPVMDVSKLDSGVEDDKPDVLSTAVEAKGSKEKHVKPDSDSQPATLGMDESPTSITEWTAMLTKHWAVTGQAARPNTHTKHQGLAAMARSVGLDQNTVNQYEVMMQEAQQSPKQDAPSRRSTKRHLFGEDKQQESAGSQIIYDLLPQDLADTIFDELNSEAVWQKMHHQTGEVPRLVCCQGTIAEDGSMPVYRHPSDQTLAIQSWTPAVDRVRKAAEEAVGHSLNHALIQLYRGGGDYISEHSDKTLDIAKGSFIANVSFGAQRTMRFRTKRGANATPDDATSSARTTYRVPMPHNSLCKMSLETNAEFLHGINADKRPTVELTEAEEAFGGQRISLTFRNIGTFLNHDSSLIWGRGATAKHAVDARPVVNGNVEESERLVRAFGSENQASSINWDDTYGRGFDVLHLTQENEH